MPFRSNTLASAAVAAVLGLLLAAAAAAASGGQMAASIPAPPGPFHLDEHVSPPFVLPSSWAVAAVMVQLVVARLAPVLFLKQLVPPW